MSYFHIVLVEPQIPQNTGNIGRLCVATDSTLHLIRPLGFSTEQKELKRAGLDYWHRLNVQEWENLEHFWQAYPFSESTHFLFSTKAKKICFDAPLQNGGFLYFGREDAGLDSKLLEKYANNVYKLPMTQGTRSINLATSVGAVLYQGINQSKCFMQWQE